MAIVQQNPVNFQTNVIRNPFIWIKFDYVLDRSTVNDYTVLLVETENPSVVIPGKVDYIIGTSKVTFQLFDFLKKNTNYTVILVGGDNGIKKQTPNEPWSLTNYTFSFTTGESIDWNLPLATSATYTDGPYFQGEAGIYKEVFGRTGEPVSHIVTTSASVSPSGKIVPAPFGPERYLPPSGEDPADTFQFVSSDPANEEVGVTDEKVTFTFSHAIKSVDSVTLKVSDLLDFELADESNSSKYSYQIDDKVYTITPSGSLDGLTKSANYEIILNTVTDTSDRTISLVTIGFQTKLSPYYSTVKIIRLNLGSLVSQISDSEIQEVIYENSVWAYENMTEDTKWSIDSPSKAAKEYVMCKTKLDFLNRYYLKGGPVQSKQLADLRIEYGPALLPMIQRKADMLEACVKKNELLITTGNKFYKVETAVKSYWDSRKPKWSRLKKPDDFGE